MMAEQPKPLFFVPNLIWNGGDQLYKVPFHTFGSIKRRQLRLKPSEPNSIDWIDVALVSGDASSKDRILKAACPLALVWGDAKPNADAMTAASPSKTAFLSSPFSRRVKEENEVLIQDITEIVVGNNTNAFQSFIAKNGRSCIPASNCCFSIITHKRSVDFFVSSGGIGGKSHPRDIELAHAWVDSLRSLTQNFNQRQRANAGLIRSSLEMIRQKDMEVQSQELFDAARARDLGKLRFMFDSGVSVDLMDSTGDTVLIIACRLGLYDVCKLALHEYHAKNDPHPDFGQTALQVAVSSGHAKIVKLILDTAEPSGADKLISNHEDGNGEAPIHVAARCGSVKCMELLLTHGANLSYVDGRGRTCLHCACISGHAACLAFALDFGAVEYIDVRQDNGFTALHLAIRSNSIECVEILLQAGADLAAETADGSNAYELASRQKNQAVMKLLLEYDGSSRDDSYSDSSYESLSGDDIFAGLNTFAITPAKSFMSPMNTQIETETPSTYFSAREDQTPGFNSTPGYFPSPSPGRFQFPQVLTSPPGVMFNRHPSMMSNYLYRSPINLYSPGLTYNGYQFNHGGDEWTVCYTDDGHQYFFNSETNESTWEDPRAKTLEQQAGGRLVDSPQTPSVSVANISADNHVRDSIDLTTKSETCHQLLLTSNVSTKQLPSDLASGQPAPSELMAVKPQQQTKDLEVHDNNQNHDPRADLMEMPKKRKSPPTVANMSADNLDQGSTLPEKLQDAQAETNPEAGNKNPAILEIDNALPRKYDQVPSGHTASSDLASGQHVLITPKPFQQISGSEAHDNNQNLDPRRALMDILKQRNPPNRDSNEMPAKKRSDSDAPCERENVDPRAALMEMLKKRNNSNMQKKEEEEKHELTSKQTPSGKKDLTTAKDEPRLSAKDAIGSQISNNAVDPRTALMAVLKTRNPPPSQKSPVMINNESKLSKDTLRSPNSTIESVQTKRVSKDDLMNDPDIQKFMKMTSFGVPPEAVVHKMKQDSVDQEKIDLFKEFHGLIAKMVPQLAAPKQQQEIIPSKDELMNDIVLTKYVKMTKVGVPPPAVVSKMKQESVPAEKIHMFNLAFGLVKVRSPKRSPIPPPRNRRRSSVALAKIHWNTVDTSKIKNSVWSSNEDSELDEADIAKLESLFATVQTNRAAAAGRKAAAKKDTKKKASLIEPKRANNIAISLAQYRSFENFDAIVNAVVTLDGQNLNAEKLQNMQALLPTKDEMTHLEKYGSQTDGLGRAELFFLAIMKAPRFPLKLASFKFSLQFDDFTKTLSSNLHLLSTACDEVMNSKKLVVILRRFLAIGNVMNESAGKPIASGITLDSLIKTAKMKGIDGQSTILDSVIGSKLELADFRLELPTLRDAMRLDLIDLQLNMKEIESNISSVESAIKAERSEVESREDGLISESSEKFLQKLEPFLIMATKEIQNIKTSFEHVEERVCSLCSFFAEDKSTKASTIFGVILEFSQLVEESSEQLRRREAAKRREALRTPVKSTRSLHPTSEAKVKE